MSEAHAELRALLGLEVTEAEIGPLLAAYAEIGREIARLRELDLTDTHPAVIFDPTLPYRQADA